MGKLFLLLLLPFSLSAQLKPKDFTVVIKMDNLKPGDTVYLSYEDQVTDQETTDSLVFKEDKIIFRGKLLTPQLARLYYYTIRKIDTAQMKASFAMLPGSDEEKEELMRFILNPRQMEMTEFFLDEGETTIKGTNYLRKAKVEGSALLQEYFKLKKEAETKLYSLMNSMDDMDYNPFEKQDSARQELMAKKMDSIDKIVYEEVYIGYVREHPNSGLALYALESAVPVHIDTADKYISFVKLLSPDIQAWPATKRFLERLRAAKNSEIGMTVPDFDQVDSLGRKVSFSSYKGKYVLLELWASWCGPCRKKNPGLLEVYNKYHDKNFTIVGIGLEQKEDKDKWLKAIHKDQLTWPQLTDFKFWKNSVATHFGVRAIPFNLLVDPQGKIIGKDLYGQELDEKLAALLGK